MNRYTVRMRVMRNGSWEVVTFTMESDSLLNCARFATNRADIARGELVSIALAA